MDQRRQRLYRTPAIVLKRQDFGEADRILTLFTPEYGKLRVIAKGVRKLTSRKRGHIELFNYSNLLIAKGRNLDIVTQADTIRVFRGLREDLSRITYAYYIAELVDKFTQERDENQRLFELLLDTLQALAQSDDLRLRARYFELRLLDYIGYRPQLFCCVLCDKEIEPVNNYFGIEAGGVLCPDCVTRAANESTIRETPAPYRKRSALIQPISLNALKVLRYMQRGADPAVNQLRLRNETHREMERIMQNYLTHLLERNLKSVEFLEAL